MTKKIHSSKHVEIIKTAHIKIETLADTLIHVDGEEKHTHQAIEVEINHKSIYFQRQA